MTSKSETGGSRQPAKSLEDYLSSSPRPAAQRYRRDTSLMRKSSPFVNASAPKATPEELALIEAEIAQFEGSTSELAGFPSWDSLESYPSLLRRPPPQLVLQLTDVVVGHSTEVFNDLSELRFLTSAQYRVEK